MLQTYIWGISCLHSFNKYLLSTYKGPGTVLGIVGTAASKRVKTLPLWNLHCSVGRCKIEEKIWKVRGNSVTEKNTEKDRKCSGRLKLAD